MAATAAELIALLDLQRHPTCGFVARTFESSVTLPADALPAAFPTARPAGAVLCFLVTTDVHVVMHRIPADQMYHHYQGDPLEVLLLYPDGQGEVRTMGQDLQGGQRPQLLIPAGTFHMSRPKGPLGWSLLGTSEWIGVEPTDVEQGDRTRLTAAYPAMAAAIAAFMGAE